MKKKRNKTCKRCSEYKRKLIALEKLSDLGAMLSEMKKEHEKYQLEYYRESIADGSIILN